MMNALFGFGAARFDASGQELACLLAGLALGVVMFWMWQGLATAGLVKGRRLLVLLGALAVLWFTVGVHVSVDNQSFHPVRSLVLSVRGEEVLSFSNFAGGTLLRVAGTDLIDTLEPPYSVVQVDDPIAPAPMPPTPGPEYWEPSPPIPRDETPGPGWVRESHNVWRWDGDSQVIEPRKGEGLDAPHPGPGKGEGKVIDEVIPSAPADPKAKPKMKLRWQVPFPAPTPVPTSEA